MFVINSPSNPSGSVYSLDELKALGEVLLDTPISSSPPMTCTSIFCFPEENSSISLTPAPSLYERTMVLNGVSKAYAMTGWRIGYCGGPAHIITAMENIQSQSTSNPASISQAAAEAALNRRPILHFPHGGRIQGTQPFRDGCA